ncbi:MAG TPA: MTH1187 family thiamine-binding protein [Candidatus Aminicenantes bacterium]|nr:MTH1187 family thiamine-binding protein [Candidatus Aminicenantes bacterium]
MRNVIAQVTVVPLGTDSTSLSAWVAGVEKVLDDFPDIRRQLCPMSTVLEGELDRILEAVRRMHEAPFLEGARRVSTHLNIDDRRDKAITMEGKVRAVREKLMVSGPGAGEK